MGDLLLAPDLLVPEQAPVAERVSETEGAHVTDGEIDGEKPAGSREGLAHEGREVRAAIDEQNSPRQERVQERGRQRDESVAQPAGGSPEHVLAVHRGTRDAGF